jgi:hypothetical protein
VESQFAAVLSSRQGAQFVVLGSWFWNTEKTNCKRDRVDDAAPITTWWGGTREIRQDEDG